MSLSKQVVLSEMHIEFIRKRKMDLELELELLSYVERASKKPRNDLNIERPPRNVNQIPDKVWLRMVAGLSELCSNRQIQRFQRQQLMSTRMLPPFVASIATTVHFANHCANG